MAAQVTSMAKLGMIFFSFKGFVGEVRRAVMLNFNTSFHGYNLFVCENSTFKLLPGYGGEEMGRSPAKAEP